MKDIGLEVQNEIKKFSNLLTRYARNNNVNFGKEKITRSQALILKFITSQIECGEKVYQKDIEQQFSIRRSTATESLKRLEAQGLITRKTSPIDARLKEIHLTEMAKEINNAAENNINSLCNIIGKDITKEELLTIKNVIIKMQNNLKEHNQAIAKTQASTS